MSFQRILRLGLGVVFGIFTGFLVTDPSTIQPSSNYSNNDNDIINITHDIVYDDFIVDKNISNDIESIFHPFVSDINTTGGDEFHDDAKKKLQILLQQQLPSSSKFYDHDHDDHVTTLRNHLDIVNVSIDKLVTFPTTKDGKQLLRDDYIHPKQDTGIIAIQSLDEIVNSINHLIYDISKVYDQQLQNATTKYNGLIKKCISKINKFDVEKKVLLIENEVLVNETKSLRDENKVLRDKIKDISTKSSSEFRTMIVMLFILILVIGCSEQYQKDINEVYHQQNIIISNYQKHVQDLTKQVQDLTKQVNDLQMELEWRSTKGE